ncbi:GNAT family N-acetyltransferase [Caproicibacter fermentans]|nr:GNAT family N-acetyltransferase [Caproicibacter fermentans]
MKTDRALWKGYEGMEWTIKRFEELTLQELYDILRLRCEVFVVEQSCPYPDVDGRDSQSFQLFGCDAQGKICACLRILDRGQTFPEHSIGRVLVRRDCRGSGLAREMLNRAVRFVKETGGGNIRIEAQAHLREFYRQAGFTPCSPVYLEDGIEHIEMLYQNEN